MTDISFTRDDLLSIPLREVQEQYFAFLELYFRQPYAEMLKYKLTPYDVARSMASRPQLVKALEEQSDEFEKGLIEFWRLRGPIVEAHLKSFSGLKSVYGGDIFPPHGDNILSSTALYVDITILPDPLLRTMPFFKLMDGPNATFYLAKHALAALALKDVVLAPVDPPIAVIAPDYFQLSSDVQRLLDVLSRADLITHAETLFGRAFANREELDLFLSKLDSLGTLKERLTTPDRLLFDTRWRTLPLEDQWSRSQEINNQFAKTGAAQQSIGDKLAMDMSGRMLQANDLLYKAEAFGASPVVDAPTSWQYLLWKYEYDQAHAHHLVPNAKQTLVVNALQTGALSWLGRVPNDALVTLRKNGALESVRAIVGNGLTDLDRVNDDNFADVAGSVIANIDSAFASHQKELDEVKSSAKRYFGLDVGPWIVAGGISIAAASTQHVSLDWADRVVGIIGVSNGREVLQKGRALLGNHRALKRSPVGMLFDAHKKAIANVAG